jgi:putative tryptophan/tyrosine transport system substrate-binding protein
MKRRTFITLLGGTAAAWPLAVRAQQPEQMRRIGMLDSLAEGDPVGKAQIGAFKKGLQALGWTDNLNVRIEDRWTGGDAERMRTYAQELVSLAPDVIVARNTAMMALQQTTRSIPIVFIGGADPVTEGFVASLARPGGNITGFSNNAASMATKRLQLLMEIAPRVARVAFIYDPTTPGWAAFLAELEVVSSSLNVRLSANSVHNSTDIEAAITALAREPNGGLFVYAGGATNVHRELIVTLTNRNNLPSVYGYRYFVTSGGLVSYGVDATDQYRRAASYVDRILKGEKPSNLPAQQPTKFELVINLKTAKALGLELPAALIARADEVIE